MRGYNFPILIEKGLLIEWVSATGIAKERNTFPISSKYIAYTQFVGASVLLKTTVSIEEWMTES